MATAAERAQLREMINEPDETGGWTDERLDAVIDATLNKDGSTNLRAAAASIWNTKAGEFVTLVDVTESSSSRRMSQAFDHALKMANAFTDAPPDTATSTRPRSTRIVRPTRG